MAMAINELNKRLTFIKKGNREHFLTARLKNAPYELQQTVTQTQRTVRNTIVVDGRKEEVFVLGGLSIDFQVLRFFRHIRTTPGLLQTNKNLSSHVTTVRRCVDIDNFPMQSAVDIDTGLIYPIPDTSVVCGPLSTHTHVDWEWKNARFTLVIHLKNSYFVPVGKYPTRNDGIINREIVLMPGTLTFLYRDLENGHFHFSHTCDMAVAFATTIPNVPIESSTNTSHRGDGTSIIITCSKSIDAAKKWISTKRNTFSQPVDLFDSLPADLQVQVISSKRKPTILSRFMHLAVASPGQNIVTSDNKYTKASRMFATLAQKTHLLSYKHALFKLPYQVFSYALLSNTDPSNMTMRWEPSKTLDWILYFIQEGRVSELSNASRSYQGDRKKLNYDEAKKELEHASILREKYAQLYWGCRDMHWKFPKESMKPESVNVLQ